METKSRSLRQILAAVFWPTVILAIIFFIAHRSLGDNPNSNIRIWYFAGIFSYIVVGGTLIIKTDFNHFKFLFFINVLSILFLIIGFFLHFFIAFPLPIQVIFGWPAPVSIIIFIILTFMACLGS